MLREITPDNLPERAIAALAASGCLVFGAWLAVHHPLSPTLAVAALILWSIAVFLRPVVWLFVVPALLPIIDLATLTGWMITEEFDLLVLGAAAGAYASFAWQGRPCDDLNGKSSDRTFLAPLEMTLVRVTANFFPPAKAHLSWISIAMVGLLGVSTAVGFFRGIDWSATPLFGWFDGYFEAANSLRVAKSYFLALLMLPPLMIEMRRFEQRALGALATGLATGLGLASLAILWERLAFPGLLNFSSDYRTTALFWEMHVGGAALDGFLALTVPFVVREILHAHGRARLLLMGAIALLAAYACLTTFSRGVYLAIPVSLALLYTLLKMKGNVRAFPSATGTMLKVCALVVVMAALSYWVFRTGGYRSLLAVMGVFAMTLPLGAITRDIPARGWAAALALGVLVGTAGSTVALQIDKGVYVNFCLAFGCCAVLVAYRLRTQSDSMSSAILGLGAYLWLIISSASVALGWGGVGAWQDTLVVLSILLALTIWNARATSSVWPERWQMQCAIVGMATLAAFTAAVFSGGGYMTERFSSSEQDLGGRMQHWRDGVGMLTTSEEWFLGKGAGRFPQNYLFNLRDRAFPGGSSLGFLNGERYLVLSGPRQEAGFGEIFRVAQRVHVTPGSNYSIVLDARASNPGQLHVELCERHLLYVGHCAIATASIPATGSSWRRHVLELNGREITGGPWYAPRLTFFAVAAESPRSRIEIDNISLIGPDGSDLLDNGHFAQGMTRWFTTSDRSHLPWHIKNVGLNVLFDDGAIGLLISGLLICGALFRLMVGRARHHPAAPFLAAALVGFLLVGLFDSLLDVPRVAFLYYLLTLLSLVLPAEESQIR